MLNSNQILPIETFFSKCPYHNECLKNNENNLHRKSIRFVFLNFLSLTLQNCSLTEKRRRQQFSLFSFFSKQYNSLSFLFDNFFVFVFFLSFTILIKLSRNERSFSITKFTFFQRHCHHQFSMNKNKWREKRQLQVAFFFIMNYVYNSKPIYIKRFSNRTFKLNKNKVENLTFYPKLLEQFYLFLNVKYMTFCNRQ